MHIILVLAVVLAAVFGPQLWAKHVLAKHARHREDLEDTGGEFARLLLDGLQLPDVRAEPTPGGDHYDPLRKTVRLNQERWDQRSLTAHVVAAHEVGHAVQDASGFEPFHARTRLVVGAQWVQRIGAGLMIAIPLVAILTRSPRVGLLMLLLGLATIGSSFVVHLVTLPVEWDASFRRALPILSGNGLIAKKDRGAAREILTACALTYVASSLASLLNLWRWLTVLRR